MGRGGSEYNEGQWINQCHIAHLCDSLPAKRFVQAPLKSMDFCAGGRAPHWFVSLGSHITGSSVWILSIKQLVLSEWQMQK